MSTATATLTRRRRKAAPPEVVRAAAAFRLLGERTRLGLCLHLHRHGETCVGDLAEVAGQAQPAVSHHLCLLKLSGVVTARRSGKQILYALVAGHPAAAAVRAWSDAT
jgi:DNA-binding transcriptional ArsR family regulator